MSDNKPDNVADNPGLLPYGSNIGAPSIQSSNIERWKEPRIDKLNKHYKERYDTIKKEYQNLIEEYKWNDIVYKSRFSFEPVVGNVYHLYEDSNGKTFLSIISPNEWNKPHVGTFKYDYENKWIKIEWNN